MRLMRRQWSQSLKVNYVKPLPLFCLPHQLMLFSVNTAQYTFLFIPQHIWLIFSALLTADCFNAIGSTKKGKMYNVIQFIFICVLQHFIPIRWERINTYFMYTHYQYRQPLSIWAVWQVATSGHGLRRAIKPSCTADNCFTWCVTDPNTTPEQQVKRSPGWLCFCVQTTCASITFADRDGHICAWH